MWSVSDCINKFKSLCKDAFTHRAPSSLRTLTMISRKSIYKTKPLESALQSAFGADGLLYGKSKTEGSGDIRVAVTSTRAVDRRPVILSNYNTEGQRETCEQLNILLFPFSLTLCHSLY